jgi:hypothetical protein
MILKRMFHFPVYKDQTIPANAGKLIVAGDNVVVIVANHDGTVTERTLLVAKVEDGGKSILWDTQFNEATSQNLHVEDISRVHVKHEYSCPGEASYTIAITSNSTTLATALTSVTVNGVLRPITTAVEDAGGATIHAGFGAEAAAAINAILAGNGYASVQSSAGETTTILISGTPLVFTAAGVANGTSVVTKL